MRFVAPPSSPRGTSTGKGCGGYRGSATGSGSAAVTIFSTGTPRSTPPYMDCVCSSTSIPSPFSLWCTDVCLVSFRSVGISRGYSFIGFRPSAVCAVVFFTMLISSRIGRGTYSISFSLLILNFFFLINHFASVIAFAHSYSSRTQCGPLSRICSRHSLKWCACCSAGSSGMVKGASRYPSGPISSRRASTIIFTSTMITRSLLKLTFAESIMNHCRAPVLE
mmetsp:Transcript_1639/g.3838  ORF Transcript_1639/g.3838 Transcript_1639/m.3838 type:complete len:222 (-) Transcript_1639:278-943(-)